MNVRQILHREVRAKMGWNQDNKSYFSKSQAAELIEKVTGKTVCDKQSVFGIFENNVQGWAPQKTVDTHPSVQNLEFLIESLKQDEYSLEDILRSLPTDFLSTVGSSKLDGKTLTFQLV